MFLTEKEDYIKLEEFRAAIAKLTADREVFKNAIEAHEKLDVAQCFAHLSHARRALPHNQNRHHVFEV
ncbi:hypothetical protein GWO13_05625 [Candidatus Bathyarchaeota archaeon]|nr:hypothetical protein [Candidatus Bathyarchaeota archaeon]NIW51953.1 hypothetical protein [Candidatus Korarchaeota archaeon]